MRFKPWRDAKKQWLWVIFGTFAATMVAVLLFMNFSTGEKEIEQRIERLYTLDDPRFAYELGVLLGPAFTQGNKVVDLQNGDRIFPSMLEAIRGAKASINFETYIYWSGEIGKQFADALSERAKAGVKVHVLLDWVGSAKVDDDYLRTMREAGVRIEKFHPPHWSNLGRMNNRTHRKLLVVDGNVAFTGGVGVAPQWTGDAQDPEHWRDSHYRVEGPVVAQMQSVFLDNWIKVTGEVLLGAAYFPPQPPQPVGPSSAQMFSSSPTGGAESMQLMYLLSITAASRTIDLAAAYFVPDEMASRALVAAMKRGVRVRIVVPGEHIDSETVRKASRARWGDLLAAGAVIAEYRPTMYHCKVLIVDGVLVSVGSTNFDNRSFRLNDEATLNVFDAAFAQRQTAIFEADLAKAQRVTHAQWLQRPRTERLMEHVASLIGDQL